MFEGFLVDGLFLAEQPLLALYSLGKLSGCVADIGHDKCGEGLKSVPLVQDGLQQAWGKWILQRCLLSACVQPVKTIWWEQHTLHAAD